MTPAQPGTSQRTVILVAPRNRDTAVAVCVLEQITPNEAKFNAAQDQVLPQVNVGKLDDVRKRTKPISRAWPHPARQSAQGAGMSLALVTSASVRLSRRPSEG